ncbi:GTPase, G3E family [Andreprevotia lacus DSM 23236]|jgi:G3E family GTPase|uniref:GTPase, G3E family n=1 Tax=Andreprevotia lacus DSM 23236 TaxID=1121001 RepID=A0A1W1XSZ0_9NEIS|nr:CobW family GTP-binding protein [Andreprevotia lacus]SMC26955.1 GTPase, G3E family [Andreprevotia lacus DSM 23236]
MNEKIPVNLITGFLGVGKTTALLKLLADKPADEYWAVIVNEFGEVGIDGATLSGDGGDDVRVAEVPGGCICCTTSPMLRVALGKIARPGKEGQRPDRLLIEPSGLGHPAGIVDLLRDPMVAGAYALRAVVTLLDPRHLDDARYNSHQTWRDQIELADVLVINKGDLADAEQVDRAHALADALFPPKLAVVDAYKGAFDPALLDLTLDEARWPQQPQAHVHSGNAVLQPRRRTTEAVAEASTQWPLRKTQSSLGSHSCGWILPPETLFHSAKLADLFERLGDPAAYGLAGLSRAKGVFQTERDWYRFDWVDGMAGAAVSAYRRDNRFEVIVEAATPPDWAALEQALLAAAINFSAGSP